MAYTEIQPRLRVNRTTAITLSNSWQKLVFNGSSDANVNTFGKDPVSGKPMVDWDGTNGIFRFYEKNDQNYLCFLNVSTAVTQIGTRATVQYRCVIPNGVSQGVPYYFPFPDAGGYADIAEMTVLAGAMLHRVQPFPLYLNQSLRANGFWIEVRMNTTLAIGSAQITSTDFLIQSTV